jgi:hypothetical protein
MKTNLRIAFLLSPKTSIAVWNSLKLHIELCLLCGITVDIYKSIRMNDSLIQDEYKNNVIEYDSYINLRRSLNKGNYDYIWCPDSLCVLLLKLLFVRCNKIIYWVQGTAPYESLMKHQNYLKFWVLSLIETLSFYCSDAYVFVSESMKEFYEKKYNIGSKLNIVVPCLSEFSNNHSVSKIEKIKNSFVYIGGISVWQCFEETLDIYSKVRTEDTIFHIITPDIDKAKELVSRKIGDAKDIEIYCIKDRTRIPETLSKFEYGFLIRKDNPVNYVASPIKFVEYLSCGVNVILTKALPAYAKLVEEYSIGTVVDINNGTPKINYYSDNAQKIYTEHFNKQIFIDRYKNLLSNLIG